VGEPYLSIIGGGLVAAVITLVFNALWDKHKQKLMEDWEFKRYQANAIHFSTMGLMEAYFSSCPYCTFSFSSPQFYELLTSCDTSGE
jgi:hypothetical protein